MPRPRKKRPEKFQRRWYHYVPSVLWYAGSAALSAKASQHYGPVAAAALGGGLSSIAPNPDWWDPKYHDGTYDAYEGAHGYTYPYAEEILGPRSIPDIDDVSHDWQWVSDTTPYHTGTVAHGRPYYPEHYRLDQ